jgi:hypothetical protein
MDKFYGLDITDSKLPLQVQIRSMVMSQFCLNRQSPYGMVDFGKILATKYKKNNGYKANDICSPKLNSLFMHLSFY